MMIKRSPYTSHRFATNLLFFKSNVKIKIIKMKIMDEYILNPYGLHHLGKSAATVPMGGIPIKEENSMLTN